MGGSADDQTLTLAQLATEAGVSVSVLRSWAKLPDRPLEQVPHTGRAVLHTWAQLRAFCETHPDRPAVRKITCRRTAYTAGPDLERSTNDPERVRAVLRNLRAIAVSNFEVALIAARQAESTAIAHREQLEAVAASINAYDDLLTQLTAPTTLND